MNLTLLLHTALFAVLLSTAAECKEAPSNDPDLAVAEDPSVWKAEGEFVPFAGDRFDAFDWRMFNEVSRSAGPSTNAVISPISIKVLLAMLYEGASDKTAKVLEQILSIKDRQEGRNRYSGVVDSLLEPNPQFKLNMATKAFIQDFFNVRSRYQKIINYYYNADIEKVDFTDARTAQNINEWVAKTTEDNIKDLVEPDDLKDVMMMLVNAIFFEGTWLNSFSKDDTGPAQFYPASGLTYTTPFMSQTSDFFYYNSSKAGAQILRMPYMGDKFSMFVILPHSPSGLDKLIENLTPNLIRELLWNMTATFDVRVFLPRFDFDTRTQVKEILQSLGIHDDIFTMNSNFQGIAAQSEGALFVGNIVQKALIDVNEAGTKAAAATQVSLVNRIGTGGAIFNARHPFLFFIEDETTGTVLFVGKVVRPGNPPATLPTSKPTASVDLANRFGDLDPEPPRKPAVTSHTGSTGASSGRQPPTRRPEPTTPASVFPVQPPTQSGQPVIWVWPPSYFGSNSFAPNPFSGSRSQFPQLVWYPVYAPIRK